MSFVEKISAVEAILFAYGEPIAAEQLSEASGIELQSLDKIIRLLNDRYDEADSSLQVLRLDDSYQLATRKQYSPYVKRAFETGRNAALSSAALESLAVVAYNQPVTKSFVETVRGVDSSAVMNKLVEKGLIEEAERLEVPGRPIAYKTTKNFLRCFGISSLSELPPLKEQDSEQTTLFDNRE
ncbi:MAG: SMC-Scp complex subunit ScpB [Ruminococcus sp.]|nr:SMC-Scp complex subunit ScpB [Ruminococcus sp.]